MRPLSEIVIMLIIVIKDVIGLFGFVDKACSCVVNVLHYVDKALGTPTRGCHRRAGRR